MRPRNTTCSESGVTRCHSTLHQCPQGTGSHHRETARWHPNQPHGNDNPTDNWAPWLLSEYDIVVIAGDFNLPDIDWSKQQITNNRTASKHNKLLEIINKFGLQNMLNNPTRIDSGNILDLILTSNPSIIVNTHTTPGMSDLEAVTFNINLNPIRNRKPPQNIPILICNLG